MTAVGPAVVRAAARLQAAGVPSPRHDAEVLAAHVLGTARAGLSLHGDWQPAHQQAYDLLIAERAGRVPLQHLTGVAGFRYLELAVGPGVFIPRPETEVLVSWGLDRLTGREAPAVVDLCAGAGAIALSVAQECPTATVYAVEREKLALAWLRRNADDTPVRVIAGDATDPAMLTELDGTVDLVLCNPPYIPVGAQIEPEVARHDPPAALWGGPDGLDVVRGIVRRAGGLLRAGGWLAVEHADRQGATVPALLRAAGGWEDVTDHPDLAGRDRFTTARRTR
ncbi:MAG: peptide chain release factor N(5)-glutamine methyltransferase [Actinomycetota bacterium]|nr:peptide chain release factor N(5)-glutamine methyltransferase [Actinomycetota bacterium]